MHDFSNRFYVPIKILDTKNLSYVPFPRGFPQWSQCLPVARVGVDVHLHHARFDGVADVLQTGAAAAVEDEGDGLVAVAAQLLLFFCHGWENHNRKGTG